MTTETVALCNICRRPVPRPYYRTCGPECRHEWRSRVAIRVNAANAPKRRAKALAYDHPPCEAPGCGKPVEIRDGEAPYYWRRRKACSRRCATALSLRAVGQSPRVIGQSRRPKRRYIRLETVEEALARGLEIQRYSPAYAAPSSAALS